MEDAKKIEVSLKVKICDDPELCHGLSKSLKVIDCNGLMMYTPKEGGPTTAWCCFFPGNGLNHTSLEITEEGYVKKTDRCKEQFKAELDKND